MRSFEGPFDLPVSFSDSFYDLKLGPWTIYERADGAHVLHATLGTEIILDAVLETGKPFVQNGDAGNGISRKSSGASAHFSFTRMPLTGTINDGGVTNEFTGSAWMDREYGTFQQSDWDWFSIQFDNGTELMIYGYRPKMGELSGSATGTFVDTEGNSIYLKRDEFVIDVLSTWTSPHTGAEYPAMWKVAVPTLGLELTIRPFLTDQELDTRGSTMVIYWEGACEVTGTRDGREISGKAYVELVGYDRSNETAGITEFLFGDPIKKLTRFIDQI